MEAKKCDRCGAFYSSYEREAKKTDSNKIKALFDGNRNGIRMSRYEGYCSQHIDLCPSCLEELLKWLDKEAK